MAIFKDFARCTTFFYAYCLVHNFMIRCNVTLYFHSFIHSFKHSFNNAFIHSIMHSFIRSFVDGKFNLRVPQTVNELNKASCEHLVKSYWQFVKLVQFRRRHVDLFVVLCSMCTKQLENCFIMVTQSSRRRLRVPSTSAVVVEDLAE